MFANLLSSVLVAASTASFDYEAWQSKREILAREAERLQSAYSNCTQRAEVPSENVKIPIETFDDGSIKTLLTAAKVKIFLDSTFIWADTIVVDQRAEKESAAARIEATTGVVDRETKSGWAQGPTRLVYDTTTCDGEDVYFSSPEGFVSISRNARIIAKDLKMNATKRETGNMRTRGTNLLGGSDESLMIQSERCVVDREQGVVFFEEKVCVTYGAAYTLKADQVYAFLSEANELTRIVAIGHVKITNDSRKGSCVRAVFRRDLGEIEMFGTRGETPAHLEEQDGNAVDGSRIKFWLDVEQVEVIDSVLTVKTGGKGDLKKL